MKVNCNIESITKGPPLKTSVALPAIPLVWEALNQPKVLCEHNQSWEFNDRVWLFV